MTKKQKNKLIDAMNEAFQEEVKKQTKSKYRKSFNKLVEEMIEKRPRTRREIYNLMQKHQIDFRDNILMFNVLNTVTSLIARKPTGKAKELSKGMVDIMRGFNILNPKRFARSVWKMIKGSRTQTAKEKRFRPILLSYYDGFTENIEEEVKQSERALLRTRLETMNDLFRDIEELREQRISAPKIKKQLLEKYDDSFRINRALDTELHEQAERTKMEQSKFMGFTHKQWNTQGDERVRNTLFHNTVKSPTNRRIPIDATWKVGTEAADYPGDIRLSAKERIFCRCYVTYHNGPTGQ